MNTDRGNISVSVLLDLYAGFDMVDRNIVINRLETELDFLAFKWFESNLKDLQASSF